MLNKVTASLFSRVHGIPRRRFTALAWLTLILMAAALLGCGNPEGQINVLTSIELIPEPPPGGPGGFAFAVNGVGKCETLHIDWGDGVVQSVYNHDLRQKSPIFHDFAGWGGGKTITAFAVSGCEGTARTNIEIAPGKVRVPFQAGPTTCMPVPNQPSLAGRTLIHITTIPLTGEYSYGIDFGCPAGGCRYNADGKPGSSAPARFPFPGLREFSLVIRIGTDIFQGGTNVQFTTTRTAPLELCLNDDNLADNKGGYNIDITADQLGPILATPTP